MSSASKVKLLKMDNTIEKISEVILNEDTSPIDITPFSNPNLDSLLNKRLKIDGLELLKSIPANTIKASFFDPQYRGILDKMKYGNEGKSREQRRVNLEQMSEETIISFINEISRVLVPSGHLFLWIDKFHLCQGVQEWFATSELSTVDLIVWEKTKIGMGYRTRNKCEFLLVLQKKPTKAKNVWTVHNIPNVMEEGICTKAHPHAKPIMVQTRLIEAVSLEGDIILDPAMGGGSVLTACINSGRNFIGGDING
jgi:site-specific DNA-methyltransferase (adenine-specific)